MIVENINYLRQYQQHIRQLLQDYEKNRTDDSIQIIETRMGLPTIQVIYDNHPQFIHSKYDPKKEAERFIDQFADEVDNYEHVLFYGVGLGYHIEEFMKRHPHYTFSMYEPNIDVFYQYMKNRPINQLPVSRLTEIFVETSRENAQVFLNKLAHNIQERILVIVLPTYERIFKKNYQHFVDDFKKSMSSKRSNNYVDMGFSARWTLNSLLNLPVTIQTPNILDGFEENFVNKPLIIAAAGPSLEEEYENLRYIKENKLAYIFAVGSANRALFAQNILPDAVCTYDPQEHNYGVFSTMLEKGIDTVPMIYGSSVGFETIKMYQGPKLHMITSQDTISPYYLRNNNQSLSIIDDAPTIAALTFQLGVKLGCNPIVFVGQNLGFKNNQYYSKDVNYVSKGRKVQVMDKDRQGLLLVEDVYGNQIETNPSLNNMRENIEWYISNNPHQEVYNSTKGGAAIKGAEFKPLEELISDRFSQSIVIENWYKNNQNNYQFETMYESIKKMEHSINEFQKQYKEVSSLFEDMLKNINSKKEQKLSKNIVKFDKVMKKIVANDCYQIYIQPINRIQYQALTIKTANIRKQTSEYEKAKLIIEAFQPYLNRCKLTLDQLKGSVYKVHELLDNRENDFKFYPADCGAFKYQGEWTRINQGPGERIGFKIHHYVSSEKDSSICFRFTGTSLRLFGSKNTVETVKVKLIIDNHGEIIKLNRSNALNFKNAFYEKLNLSNKEHYIDIKLLDDNKEFTFYGIEIDADSRIFHVDEVTDINELHIGKRIRAHYDATYNKVGKLGQFGYETNAFIPIQSTSNPNGDFYFIMIDENKCLADRNLQSHISWDTLKDFDITSYKGLVVLDDAYCKLRIRLLMGGNDSTDKNNEWEKYLVESDLFEDFNIEWNFFKNQLVWCFGDFINEQKTVVRGYCEKPNINTEDNINSWGLTDKNRVGIVYFRPLLIIVRK